MRRCALAVCLILHSADGFVGQGAGLFGAKQMPPRSTHALSTAPVMRDQGLAHNFYRRQPLISRGSTQMEASSTSIGSSTESLLQQLEVDNMKQGEVEACLDRYNAVYTILWTKEGDGPYRVAGHYTHDVRRRAMRVMRGDNKTFASESAKIAIPSNGTNLIATASRSGEEVIISNPGRIWSLKRRFLAQEFGIKHIHFVPVQGGAVMEYGRLAGEELEIIRLLRLEIPHVTNPTSFSDFTKHVMETFWLLLLLVKIEREDVRAGFSKAWVEFNAAAYSMPHSRRASIVTRVAAPCFIVARAVFSLFKGVRNFWRYRQRRNDIHERRRKMWQNRKPLTSEEERQRQLQQPQQIETASPTQQKQPASEANRGSWRVGWD